MDWSKTKTIFIIVFSILNVFLYSLYLNKYTTAQNAEPLGGTSVEERMKDDGITYANLPEEPADTPYVVGKAKSFLLSELEQEEAILKEVEQGTILHVFFDEPVALGSLENADALTAFVAKQVEQGDQYTLWKVDQEKNEAIFFQVINGKTLYYSDKGRLTVHWNEEGEVIRYEQTLFEEVKPLEQRKNLLTAVQAVQNLYQRGVIRTGTHIDSASLGYWTYTQVRSGLYMFVPSWRLSAILPDGSSEEYLVNAIQGSVIQLPEEEPEEVIEEAREEEAIEEAFEEAAEQEAADESEAEEGQE